MNKKNIAVQESIMLTLELTLTKNDWFLATTRDLKRELNNKWIELERLIREAYEAASEIE